jgi:hypothetical protein
MKVKAVAAIAVVIVFDLRSYAVKAAKPPARIGQCSNTYVFKVGTRLIDTPGSGTFIQFTNGVYLVSYSTVPEAEASSLGHKVKMCLDWIPQNCPPGDNRGKIYTIVNYMTGGRFSLPDSGHFCGGA